MHDCAPLTIRLRGTHNRDGKIATLPRLQQNVFTSGLIGPITSYRSAWFILSNRVVRCRPAVDTHGATKDELLDTSTKGSYHALGILRHEPHHINHTIKRAGLLHLFFKLGIVAPIAVQNFSAWRNTRLRTPAIVKGNVGTTIEKLARNCRADESSASDNEYLHWFASSIVSI